MDVEKDVPQYRGTDWAKRRDEILDRDEEVCQRCGDYNGEGRDYVDLEVHHIVKGKHLPITDSRIDLNLVTVCSECHGWLESQGVTVEDQFRAVGRQDVADALSLLKESECTPAAVNDGIGLDTACSRDLLENFVRLKLAQQSGSDQYDLGPLATTGWTYF